MTQENVVFYNPADELDDELQINIKKIWKTVWHRRSLLIKVFCSILVFFILLTFVLPKKYEVTADLYINKSNSSNMIEVNPYALDDAAGPTISMGVDKAINNEIELIKSELVLDKVIKENNIVYKKLFGIFPNKKAGELKSAEDFYKKGKILKIENTKNTNVITIQYKAKTPELAYGVVSSLIANYIELHKEINTEKSKSDKKILETEYAKIKSDLNKRISQSSGLPAQSITGIGSLSAMSAFSKSASQAIGNIQGQYIQGERSQIAVSEETQKLGQLASKLEWAKMVEQMSDSSKVLVLKEPKMLRSFEYSSPNLFMNILLGIIFGLIAVFFALINSERKSEKVTYSMLTNNIIFDGMEKINSIETKIYSYNPKKVLVISFAQLPVSLINSIQNLSNAGIVFYDGTKDFIDKTQIADMVIIISKIDVTDAESYKTVREAVENQGKKILYDVLV